MVSIEINKVGDATRGDMQYALTQAVEALGFAYASPVAYAGPKPEDLNQMQAGARQWLEEKLFNDQKTDALATIRARNTAGNDAGILALIADVERSQNPAQLQAAMDAIERVLGSADRLFSEMIDPETRDQKIERLWAEINEAEENIAAKMKKKLESGEITQEAYNIWKGDQDKADRLEAKAATMPEGPEKDAVLRQAAAAAGKAADTAGEHLGADDNDIKVVKSKTDELLEALDGKQNSVEVDSVVAPTITLGGSVPQSSEAVYAFADISNEQSGALTVQQGGAKEITLNQGKGGGVSF